MSKESFHEIHLNGKTLYEQRKLVPWPSLVGATVVTNQGEVLVIDAVIIRNWPDGPLFEVTETQERFTMAALQRGTFKTIHPAARFAAEFARFSAKPRAEQGAQAPPLSDALVCAFDLLVFDLDDTLVASDHLASFRGHSNIKNVDLSYRLALRDKAAALTVLIDQSLLQQLLLDFPVVQFAIFTRAPRAYTEVVLETCFPLIKWSSITCFDDVPGKAKPNPAGIERAIAQAQVANRTRVALVGDSVHDIVAAYQAGVVAILFRAAWRLGSECHDERREMQQAQAIALHPDAILDLATDLPAFLRAPSSRALALESLPNTNHAHTVASSQRLDRKVYRSEHDPGGDRHEIAVHIAGRYFASHRPDSTWDFRRTEASHATTRRILEAKHGKPYPQEWVLACVNVIRQYARVNPSIEVVICPIPARPGQQNRLELFIQGVARLIGDGEQVGFSETLLHYEEGIVPNKTLNKARRYANIRDHLTVVAPEAVTGRRIVVIDDVTTSGATFFYADQYLRKAGARDVFCLAMTQTISSN